MILTTRHWLLAVGLSLRDD